MSTSVAATLPGFGEKRREEWSRKEFVEEKEPDCWQIFMLWRGKGRGKGNDPGDGWMLLLTLSHPLFNHSPETGKQWGMGKDGVD